MLNGVRIGVIVSGRRIGVDVAVGAFFTPGASVAVAVGVPCKRLVGVGFGKPFPSPEVPVALGKRVGVADASTSTCTVLVGVGFPPPLSSPVGVGLRVGLGAETVG